MSIEYLILIAGILVMFSALASKLSEWIGVPALLVFLGIGMLAGSDVSGLVYFDDAHLASTIGSPSQKFHPADSEDASGLRLIGRSCNPTHAGS